MAKLYHVPLSPFCRKVRLVLAEKRIEVDLDEVRLHAVRVDREPRLGEPGGEPLCAAMVVREAVDVVVERVDAGRREHQHDARHPGIGHGQKAHQRQRRVRFWATPDQPVVWRELLAAYPEAKVILTLHPKGAEAWYDSTMDTMIIDVIGK